MSTPKEIFLELIRPDGQPERQLRQYEALHMCLTDPCNTYLRGNRKRFEEAAQLPFEQD